MADVSPGAAAVAYSRTPLLVPEHDVIAHLVPPEGSDTIRQFRFVPLSYLTNHWDPDGDHGIDHLLYLQSLIDEEE